MTVLTQPGPYTSSTLVNGLVAYWKLDEVSGVAIDSGPNALHLTDNNTVGSAAGQVGGARLFVSAQSESLSRASSAALQTGNISYTLTAWVWLASLDLRGIISKDSSTREYLLYTTGANGRIQFTVFNGVSGGVGNAVAASFGQPPLATWIHVAAWVDVSGTPSINIQINNGVIDTAALAGIPGVGAAFVAIGDDPRAAGRCWDGRIDEVKLWKRLLTPAERAEDYANGLAGRSL